MIALKKILVATDFSEPSRLAIETAQSLTQTFKAELHLLHVVADLLHQPYVGYAPAAKFLDLVEQFEANARVRLQGLVAPDDLAKGRVVIATVAGSPAEEILKYSVKHDIDLIVCGTHGRGGVDHMVMGSVAERVVRLSRCPVLTVRAKADERSAAA